ncbi:MAG: hypothetical protein O0V67_00690 [Methanocorpusculum sp.]|nr:hypothetical protein [Methanocorpusculum sp.]
MTESLEKKNDKAWKELFEKYHILDRISSDGFFIISADEIREFREPRLMAKFDHSINLPYIFSSHGLSILPLSRGKYIIAPMKAYHQFEAADHNVFRFSFPQNIQSIDPYNIFSEIVAINCALLSGILYDFLEEDELFPTVSGRMGSHSFSFFISTAKGEHQILVGVDKSQIEIDAAFEGVESLALIEAKCDLSKDFLVRQIYYPFRLWNEKISKKVRPIFLVYSNSIFSLYEYTFEDPANYNSLRLVKQKHYSIEDMEIEITDIQNICNTIRTIPEPDIPFPQADNFKRVINLCELLSHKESLTRDDVTQNYAFDVRQTNYYTDAARYLGLLEKTEANGETRYNLTMDGQRILKLRYRERQLEFARCILSHPVFLEIMQLSLKTGRLTPKSAVVEIMKTFHLYNMDSHNTYHRRASTVRGWINWIFGLMGDSE